MAANRTHNKTFIAHIHETTQKDMNMVKQHTGINWSFEVRKFLEQRTKELKQAHALN
ncbi:hypothetical protein [Paraburkholderia aromaticivorans]|uniref:hypothetical protein n=1 Tax=Paraburkholderia aromaticivorans TaxID=2026199 RepID=UPI0038BDE0D6